MSRYQFVMRSGPQPGKVFPLEGYEVTIGRDGSNTISINDAEVSRKHARMEQRGASYVIQDLGSTNGTFINGNRVTGIQVLNGNDIVSFGENIVLIYEAVSDPNATMLSTPRSPQTMVAVEQPVSVPPPVQAHVPAPEPAFSGHVPAGPEPASLPPVKKKKTGLIVVIIIAVVLLCVIALCAGVLLWIDADATGGRWCQYLPFIAKALGATCP